MSGGHTPGPWHAHCQDVLEGLEPGDSGLRFWDIGANGGYRGAVAQCHAAEHIGGITIAERDANAHLIAAAPELLEALEGAIGALEQDHDAGCDSGDSDWEGLAYQRLEAAKAAIAKARGGAA